MRKICILGLGKTGLSAIEFFNQDQLYIYDDNPQLLSYFLDHYKVKKFNYEEVDLLFVSPGVPNNKIKKHEVITWAENTGVKITSDIEVFQKENQNAKFVGITGTNGKSTTTALVGTILKRLNSLKVEVCGNIGVPILTRPKAELYVMELSSYQLDLLPEVKLDVAVCLNVTPDHLNCYIDIYDYARSKGRIFTDTSVNIISADYEICERIAPKNSIRFSREKIVDGGISIVDSVLHVGDCKYNIPKHQSLLGKYNAENIAATVAICVNLGVAIDDILQGIESFKGLPHRMEVVHIDSGRNVTYINDSKATNSASAKAAFDGMVGKKFIWIAGGLCKDDGIESLREFFHLIEKAYLIGSSCNDFYNVLTKYGVAAEKSYTLEAALKSVREHRDTTILFSPAAASIDQWRNFEERGDFFRNNCS